MDPVSIFFSDELMIAGDIWWWLQGDVLEAGRDQDHHRRVQLLPADAVLQRGRQRLHPVRVGEGDQDGVGPAEPQLGRQLAVQLGALRPVALLLHHLHRRPDALHDRRRAVVVADRHGLHEQLQFLLLINQLKLTVIRIIYLALASSAVGVRE